MANKIQATDPQGSCGEVLKALELAGLTQEIGKPGRYTCFHRLDLFDMEFGIVPGNFTAKEVCELFKMAGYQQPFYPECEQIQTKLAA